MVVVLVMVAVPSKMHPDRILALREPASRTRHAASVVLGRLPSPVEVGELPSKPLLDSHEVRVWRGRTHLR